ncbi:FtsX-like permease family protein [Erysipelothrix rhusiopathiae]|nr:FtsX-like permease family protein [Erysipelothrix rhusiopathiae]
MVKDILREIKAKWFQFVAILIITALGVGFFVGIRVTGYDMRATGDRYMKESEVMDLEYRHSLGIDQAMLDQLSDIVDGDAVGVYDGDAFMNLRDVDGVMKVIDLNDQTEKDITLVDGRMPSHKNEVVVDKVLQEHRGFSLGDTIKLKKNDVFRPANLKIVGFAESSLYMNLERGQSKVGSGNVLGFMYGFDLDKEIDVFTSARFVFAEGADVEDQKQRIKDHEASLSSQRFDRASKPAFEKLQDAQEELDQKRLEADREFAKGAQGLTQSKLQLQDAHEELENGILELSSQPGPGDLQTKLDSAVRRFAQTVGERENILKGYETELEEGKAQYTSGLESLESKRPEIDALKEIVDSLPEPQKTEALTAIASFDKAEATLNATKLELDQNETEIKTGYERLEQGKVEFKAGQERIQKGIQEYNQGLKSLTEAEQAFNLKKTEAYDQIESGQKEIDEGLQELEEADHGKLYLLDREDVLIGYREFYQDSDRIEAIGQVFPLIFFGVAILVTLSTVTRMVDESRMQMGVYKALGYSWFASAMKFVGFTGLAWILGSILGLIMGFYMIPTLIYNAYRIMYLTPELERGFVWSYAAVPLLISFVSSVGVAMIKSMSVSREKAANLLRPPLPKSGQRILLERIPMIWDRLSFLYKVSLRNLFRNKTRFAMTVVGIGGCCGLLITGFGIKHSIYSIVDKQFDEVIQYDGMVLYDRDISTENITVTDSIHLATEAAKVDDLDVTLYVAEDFKALPNFIQLKDRHTKAPISVEKDPIVITEKLAILKNVDVGDVMTFRVNEQEYEFEIGGISENYVAHYIFMSEAQHQVLTGKKLPENMYLFNTSDDHDQVAEKLLSQDSVFNVSFLGDMRESYQDMMGNFDIVIYVIVGAAFALEVIVLLNLITMNISERYKELATLKVLGFYPKELATYILRENIILTLMSLIFGVGFGYFLHQFVVVQAELDAIMFNRELLPMSIVLAIVLTFALSIVINILMARRANNVNMSEALKTFDD